MMRVDVRIRQAATKREDLLDVALMWKVASHLPEDEVVQRKLLPLGVHMNANSLIMPVSLYL